MSRIKSSAVNIAASVFQQIISIVFGFVSRMLFIHVLGIKILGLNNTFESVLGALALADLGIQRAIVYSLYEPFKEKNTDKISEILCIYKWFYRIVALIITVGTIMFLPFLRNIITGIEFKNTYYLYFVILMFNSVASYLLAYKRVLLYVDQRDYITKLIDTLTNIIFLTLKIIDLFYLHSYIGYLVIQVVQTLFSNTIIYVYCNKNYSFIKNTTIDWKLFKKIWLDMREIIFGRIASFVYDSTDNLVISALVNTIMVGVLGNYVMLTSSIKKIINSITNPLAPIIGRMIIDSNRETELKTFQLCTHFCFIISLIFLVPTFGLIDKFILLWIGAEFIMPKSVSLLLVLDLFIFTIQGICCSFIFGKGLFKYEKFVDIVVASLNLIISISLATSLGIHGVLIGTVISEFVLWIGRSYITYIHCIQTGKREFFYYWTINIIRGLVFCISLFFAYKLSFCILNSNEVLDFIICGLLLELIVAFFYLLFFCMTNENKQTIDILKRILKRRRYT